MQVSRIAPVPRIPRSYFNLQTISRKIRSRDSSILGAADRTTYITPFSITKRKNCNGISTTLQVCYSTKTLRKVDNFLSLFFLEKSRTIAEKTKTIVAALPSNDICNFIRLDGDKYWVCCETVKGFNFRITGIHAGFGVTVLNNYTRPLKINGSDKMYSVSRYEWNTSDISPISNGNNGQLLLLQLFIGKVLKLTCYKALFLWISLLFGDGNKPIANSLLMCVSLVTVQVYNVLLPWDEMYQLVTIAANYYVGYNVTQGS